MGSRVTSERMAVEFRILGPMEVLNKGVAVPLGGAKQRAVLADLLIHANEVVSVDRLVDDVWPEGPPASSTNTLQVYVSNLRKALASSEPMLLTRRPGYLLKVAPGSLDLLRFEAQVAQARLIAPDDPAAAATMFAEALALWYGPPLGDLAFERFAATEVAQLEDRRAAAVEDWVECELTLGRQGAVVGDLQRLIDEHPLRERPRGQLMLALYRTGRQAEALQAYRAFRGHLADELGIDPSPGLQELERAILNQDPQLVAGAPGTTTGLASSLLPGMSAEGSAGPSSRDRLPVDNPANDPPVASSALPVPMTPLVGRAGELSELTTLLGSPGVRLVTMTGPGGSGKTRLAIALGEELVSRFPDGVYYVPLAAVTVTEVMWTSIAEALDVPPDGRVPPGLFSHVADRSALLVLDNLEQIPGADSVVSQLLVEAPHMVVIATSRRPLHVAAEHEHAVPPLELPTGTSLEEAERSGALQLFVQQAARVKASFKLTDDNVAQVAALCRRLDGLPLAIELAAARVKLLTPQALLARLDRALELTDTGIDRPARHQTLRTTIGWSYDLLTPHLQAQFRRLGVFSGGADLAGIDAVTASESAGAAAHDPLILVASLADASLVTVSESADGEPRVGMLETVRAYSLDQLREHGEWDACHTLHASHYLSVAERLRPSLESERHIEVRASLENDHDNFRHALEWSLQPGSPPEMASLGLRLCLALNVFWRSGGYYSERSRWFERAIECSAGRDSLDVARCQSMLADNLRITGDLDRALSCARAAVDMLRSINDSSQLSGALITLADIESASGQFLAARASFKEALVVARQSNDRGTIMLALGEYALFEEQEGQYQASLDLGTEALSIADELGDPVASLTLQHNIACNLRKSGRLEEARLQMSNLIPRILELKAPSFLMGLADDYAMLLADLRRDHAAVELLGACDALHQRLGIPRDPRALKEVTESVAKTRDALATGDWEFAYDSGRSTTIEALLTSIHAPASSSAAHAPRSRPTSA